MNRSLTGAVAVAAGLLLAPAVADAHHQVRIQPVIDAAACQWHFRANQDQSIDPPARAKLWDITDGGKVLLVQKDYDITEQSRDFPVEPIPVGKRKLLLTVKVQPNPDGHTGYGQVMADVDCQPPTPTPTPPVPPVPPPTPPVPSVPPTPPKPKPVCVPDTSNVRVGISPNPSPQNGASRVTVIVRGGHLSNVKATVGTSRKRTTLRLHKTAHGWRVTTTSRVFSGPRRKAGPVRIHVTAKRRSCGKARAISFTTTRRTLDP